MSQSQQADVIADDEHNYRESNPEKFSQYLSRRKVVFAVAYVAYVCAYLVRNNFKLTSEALRVEHGWTLINIGLVLTGFTIAYAFGKFFMGMISDRFPLRLVLSFSLGGSALLCIAIGFIDSLPLLFAAMLTLGLVQGALAPTTMAMIANWYPNRSRGSAIAVWNTSQNLGGAALPLIIVGLLAFAGPNNLAIAFWAPGLVVLVISFIFFRIGGDRPTKEGYASLTEMYGKAGEPQVAIFKGDTYWRVLRRDIFTNPLVLTLAGINALLYFMRFGIVNWMPAFLGTEKGYSLAQVQVAMSVLEWVAIPGSFLFAWIALKAPNKQSVVGAIGLGCLSALVLVYLVNDSYWITIATAGIMGALIYGPQLIVNVMTLNVVPLRAAGVAVGFVGLSGYLVGELGANLIMPILAETFSWTASLVFLASVSLVGALVYMGLRKRELDIVKV
jgi:OPA family glycerol-3-phosphate transporter-like MFS transporter